MKFKIDENLPLEVAEQLRRGGHDCASVIDERLAGRPDEAIADVCQSEGRALITLDLDFSDIRSYPPGEFPGIVVLRPPVQTVPRLLELTRRIMATLEREPLAHRLWSVDEKKIRIRGGEADEPL